MSHRLRMDTFDAVCRPAHFFFFLASATLDGIDDVVLQRDDRGLVLGQVRKRAVFSRNRMRPIIDPYFGC
jgi:hypothetical protein